MTDTPQEQTSALVPDDMIPAELDTETFQNLPALGRLTAKRRAMLYGICMNMVSENNHTDSQIAEELGFSRQALQAARIDPTFNAALVVAMREIIKGKVDKPVENLFRLAEKDVKANEILLRISEVYQPTNRNLNINANVGTQGGQSKSFTANVQDMLVRMGELGWTEERVAELVPQFKKLKDEGAF